MRYLPNNYSNIKLGSFKLNTVKQFVAGYSFVSTNNVFHFSENLNPLTEYQFPNVHLWIPRS
jgi:hypothetical protein